MATVCARSALVHCSVLIVQRPSRRRQTPNIVRRYNSFRSERVFAVVVHLIELTFERVGCALVAYIAADVRVKHAVLHCIHTATCTATIAARMQCECNLNVSCTRQTTRLQTAMTRLLPREAHEPCIRWGCTSAPPCEYNWTICARRWCYTVSHKKIPDILSCSSSTCNGF